MSNYDEELLDPTTNPVEADLLNRATQDEFPVIDAPEDNLVNLPAGILYRGKVLKKVTVQELTGAHEESIAKAQRSGDNAHFLESILRCGVEHITGVGEDKINDVLDTLLLGDRDAILLGISKSTYGDEIEIQQWQCPECGGTTDITLNTADIPVRKFKNPSDELEFDVKLRKGMSAHVRHVTVKDVMKIAESPAQTIAENDSIMLAEIVSTITSANGQETNVAAWPSAVRELSIPNRKLIFKEPIEHQPGPQLDAIPFKHDDCGKDVTLSIGLGDLFPDL